MKDLQATPGYKVQVFDSGNALSEAAAIFFSELAVKAVADRGKFTVALSGGHTPEPTYSLLAAPPFSEQVSWKNTYFFWGDERCVPLDDDQNNAHMARLALLDKIDVPKENIYPTPVNLPPADAARDYESSLKDFFEGQPPVFDLMLMGIGENGHTASLFPYTAVLHEKQVGVRALYVEEVKMHRVTMTAPLINLARNILFLVEGAGKAEVLKTILTGPHEPDKYPAQLIKAVNGEVYWFADKDAAGQLS